MRQPYTVGRRPERIDRIAKRLYGSEGNGAVELLYASNPGLAAQGAFIAAGTVLTVPDPPAAKALSVQLPWM